MGNFLQRRLRQGVAEEVDTPVISIKQLNSAGTMSIGRRTGGINLLSRTINIVHKRESFAMHTQIYLFSKLFAVCERVCNKPAPITIAFLPNHALPSTNSVECIHLPSKWLAFGVL
jgi:hypothetical protein